MEATLAMRTVVDLIREMKIDHAATPVDSGTPLDTGLGIGSLDKLILLTRMEEASKLEFAKLSDKGFEFHTVGDLARLLADYG